MQSVKESMRERERERENVRRGWGSYKIRHQKSCRRMDSGGKTPRNLSLRTNGQCCSAVWKINYVPVLI